MAREQIAEAFAELVPCDQVVVYVVDRADGRLVAAVQLGHREDGRQSSCQSLPLVAAGEPLGVVELFRHGCSFDPLEIELATALADAAATALEGALTRQRLEVLAQTDPLTGLFNQRHFYDRLEGELTRACRSGELVTLALVDIDDFKRVNDIYGHGTGDSVLVALGRLLRSAVRVSDVVCRVGGEEFAVVMPACGHEGAQAFAVRIFDHLHAVPLPEVGYMTVSAGIAMGPMHAASPRELFACADAALQAAKARGKDRAVVFEDGASLEHPESSPREVCSLAHMKMLQSLTGRLNRSRAAAAIASAIVEELRGLLAYHACCVYVVDDGRLHLAGAGSAGCDRCELRASALGGTVADELVADAADSRRPPVLVRSGVCGDGKESVVVVPLTHGAETVGAVEVVKLGDGALDFDDVRLLEVLAGQAAVAVVNVRLYEEQRREAEHAKALVRFGDVLAAGVTAADVFRQTVAGIAEELGARRASLWLPEAAGGPIELAAAWSADGSTGSDAELDAIRAVVAQALPALDPVSPLPIGVCAVGGGLRATLVLSPVAAEVGRVGVIAVAVGDEGLSDAQLRLLSGLAGSARLAIVKATELDLLRRTYLKTVAALEEALGDDGGRSDLSRVA